MMAGRVKALMGAELSDNLGKKLVAEIRVRPKSDKVSVKLLKNTNPISKEYLLLIQKSQVQFEP